MRLSWTALLGLLGAVVVSLAGVPGGAAAQPGGPKLHRELKGQAVAVVPPRTVHIRGAREASVQHRPLDGFDPEGYPALFGALAEKQLARPPLGWKATALDPGTAFYDAVETDDPDDDPATTLAAIPEGAAGAAYLAVFRYAELAYDVVEQPDYSPDGRLEVRRSVRLILDLQLVIYDVTSGDPLGTFDAETPVSVPEINPPHLAGKPFHRATVGNLKRIARTVKKEG